MGGFIWFRAAQNEAHAEATFPPEGQILEVDGHRVHAVVMGDGPDLVLVHGSSGNTRDFTHHLASRLAERYRVIVLDRPGLGYTDQMSSTGASISQQAGLLSKAAQHLGAKRPIILGQSYGGAVALAWAVHHPEALSSLVVLSAPALPWSTPLSRYYQLTSHPVLGPLIIPLLSAFVQEDLVTKEVSAIFEPHSVPTGYVDHIGAGLTLRRASLRANALQRANLLDEIIELSPRYSEIAVPTEIVHGDADTIVGLEIHARPLSQIIKASSLTVLAGHGHMPHHTAQDQVIAAIDRVATLAGLR